MIMEARRKEDNGVYIVYWQEDYKCTPLRAFFSPGAALEFRDMVNNYNRDDKERRIRALAASYRRTDIYDYPECTNLGIAKLKRIQRTDE